MQKEFFEQVEVINYIEKNYPELLYCASAGGMRTSIGTGAKMKRMGYKKGFPDLFIYEPCGGFFGLAIELKCDKGTVQPHQTAWLGKLTMRGYKAVVCYGHEEAINTIKDYLK